MPKQRAKLSPTGYKAARKGPKYTRSGIGAKPRKPKALKAHKVTMSAWRMASRYRRVKGFWNYAVYPVVGVCGNDEPQIITKAWDKTTCKRCLAKERP